MKDKQFRLKAELYALQSTIEALERYIKDNDSINWMTVSTYTEMIRERSEKLLAYFEQ